MTKHKIEELEAQVASLTLGPWFQVQGLSTLDGIAAYIDRQHSRIVRLAVELAACQQERDQLKADQADWRKGVAFIASCVGDNGLCCVSLGEKILAIRARNEELIKEHDRLKDGPIVHYTGPQGENIVEHINEARAYEIIDSWARADQECVKLRAAADYHRLRWEEARKKPGTTVECPECGAMWDED